MPLKLYVIHYNEFGSSAPEVSTVIASNKIEAIQLAKSELGENWTENYSIEEAGSTKGIIYTGYSCC